MPSRAIDSYAHAIHASQPFDSGDIDFADAVHAMHFDHHVEFPYPMHGATDCESCHTEDTNNLSDQSKSLPDLLSASEPVIGRERKIGEVPESVTGPGSRACGGRHRAELINEDAAGKLTMFNCHVKNGGYIIGAGEEPVSTLDAVIAEMMAIFK